MYVTKLAFSFIAVYHQGVIRIICLQFVRALMSCQFVGRVKRLCVSLLQTWDVSRAAKTERVGKSPPPTATAASTGLWAVGSSTFRPSSQPSSTAEPPWHPWRPSATWGAGPSYQCNAGASTWGCYSPPNTQPAAATASGLHHTQRHPGTDLLCWARRQLKEDPTQGLPDAAPCWESHSRSRRQRKGGTQGDTRWGDEGLREWDRDVWGKAAQCQRQDQK